MAISKNSTAAQRQADSERKATLRLAAAVSTVWVHTCHGKTFTVSAGHACPGCGVREDGSLSGHSGGAFV